MSGTGKSAILTAFCLTAMLLALLATAWIFTSYKFYIQIYFGTADPLNVTVLGFYLLIFLSATTSLTTTPIRPFVWMIAPTSLLAAWAIVAGPFFGWLNKIGEVATTLLGVALMYVVSPLMIFLSLLIALVVWPTATGFLAGLLVCVVSRLLAGKALWNSDGQAEAVGHCLGFAIGTHVVCWTSDRLGRRLYSLQEDGAGLTDFVALLWPIFIVAPAIHLACLWLMRDPWDEPAGEARPKRIAASCLVLFLTIGLTRSATYDDWSLLLTWPARDFYMAKFW